MPWAVVGSVAAAGIGSAASNSASNKQQDAAGAATDIARGQYRDTVERNQPYQQAGIDALGMLQSKLPYLNSNYDPNTLTSEPGYQFGLQQGQQALERSMAARGRGVSGAALKAAGQYGNDYATTKLNSAFTRDQSAKQQQFGQLQALTQIGQSSANNTSAAGQGFAGAAGANAIGAGDSAAANAISQGNIWGGLVNQGVSAYGRSQNQGVAPGTWQSTGGGTAGFGSGVAFGNQDMGQYLADGGPVRADPKVGTRAPTRTGGTGGALSREAILASLDAAHAQAQQQAQPQSQMLRGAISAPTAAALQAHGEYAGGGAIRGPGGPKDDVVPVMASNGEHMFDAASVTALGDGDNERGQALLNEMRQRIKAHHAGQKRKH